MKTSQLIGCVFLLVAGNLKAQPVYFDKTFDVSNNIEFGWSVSIADSTYITLSAGLDLFTGDGAYNISFFSKEGELTLNKAYETISSYAYVGLCNTLLTLPDSSGYVFGGSIEDNVTGDADNILVKFNNNGDKVFVKKYATNDFEALYGDALTQDDQILMVGFKGLYLEPKDILLMKTDLDGNLIWQKTYGGIENEIGYSVYEIGLMQYIIAGVKIQSNDAIPWIIVTDTAGNIVKEKEFVSGALSCAGIRIIPTQDNDLLIHGCIDTTINGSDYDFPYYVGKMDTNFNFFWKSIYNNFLQNGIYIVKELVDSSIAFVGFQEGGNPNAAEGWIGKLDKNGNKLWEHQYRHNNSLFNYFSDFEQTYDGGFIITGSSDGPTGQDLWLVKLDSMGCLEPCATNTGTFETTDNTISLQCYPSLQDHKLLFYIIYRQVLQRCL